MKAEFYDVKAKAKVSAEVAEKVQFESNGRYAFKAKTKDGRTLYRFVKKEDFDKCPAPIAGDKKCCKGKCKK
ncbi:MAG: hypothetical protein IKS20_07600 [Victivallales bacterium]|nr:hypothetical protein [Victivallales bacterium]